MESFSPEKASVPVDCTRLPWNSEQCKLNHDSKIMKCSGILQLIPQKTNDVFPLLVNKKD